MDQQSKEHAQMVAGLVHRAKSLGMDGEFALLILIAALSSTASDEKFVSCIQLAHDTLEKVDE